MCVYNILKSNGTVIVSQTLSGSATNPEAGVGFREAFNQVDNRSWNVSYHSLVYDDYAISWALRSYLGETLHATNGMAVLSESETVYGKGIARETPGISPSPNESIRIRFPRGISRLRSAYQDDPILNQLLVNPDTSLEPRRNLLLNLKDSQEGRDTPTEYAAQTPVSHESELLQIAEVLQHERVAFVELAATDV